MNAIASAVEIAAGNTFMALHQVEGLALPERARGVGKAALAADAPPFTWVTDMDLPVRFHRPLPFAGDDVQLQMTAVEGFQRAGDKTVLRRRPGGTSAAPEPA